MKLINALIIDDEESGRKTLNWLIESYCPAVKIIDMASNVKEALQLINHHKPDLLFLDINLTNGNGFEILDKLHETKIKIIFVTAHSEYAIKAFRYAALDYLLKPVRETDLIKAVSKAVSIDELNLKEKLNLLESGLQDNQKDRIMVPCKEGFEVIKIEDITHCKADGPYTNLHLKSQPKSVIVCKTLKEFEEILPKKSFQRIHKGYLININYVKKYIKGRGGDVEMENGDIIAVARAKKQDFLNSLNMISFNQ